MKTTTSNDSIPDIVSGNSYSVHHMESPRKCTPRFHSHDFYELYFFIAGDVSAYIEEHAYRMRPHDVVIFPPGVMHRAFFHNPDTHYKRMIIYIHGECLDSMTQCGFDPRRVLDGYIAKAELHRSFPQEQFDHCARLIHEIILANGDKSPFDASLIRCKITMLITLFCKYFAESMEKPSIDAAGRMAAVIAHINEHLAEPLSLDAIANKFFINKYHLSREFKEYANRTVYQYILSKRITLAKQLMHDGLQPTDVNARCGFPDYSSFYKAFRREVGLSPHQYITELRRPHLLSPQS